MRITSLSCKIFSFLNNILNRIGQRQSFESCLICSEPCPRSVPLSHSNKKVKFSWRLSQTAQFDHSRGSSGGPLIMTKTLKEPPPFGLKVFKGVRSFILTREFCLFLTSHPVAATYLEWSRDTNMPEEHVVHTLREERHLVSKLRIATLANLAVSHSLNQFQCCFI